MKLCKSLQMIALAGAMTLSSAAFAIQPTLVGINSEADGTFTHTYKIKIDESIQVSCGNAAPDPDFFSIFNFEGFVPGSQRQPAGWTFATSTNGLTPFREGRTVVSPVDIPGIPNLTWSCTGASIIGPKEITGFSVRTTIKDTMIGEYGSQVTRLEPGTLNAHTAMERKEARIGAITTPQVKARQ